MALIPDLLTAFSSSSTTVAGDHLDRLMRKLTNLEVIIDKLLDIRPRPDAIVKEHIQQMEELIIDLPTTVNSPTSPTVDAENAEITADDLEEAGGDPGVGDQVGGDGFLVDPDGNAVANATALLADQYRDKVVDYWQRFSADLAPEESSKEPKGENGDAEVNFTLSNSSVVAKTAVTRVDAMARTTTTTNNTSWSSGPPRRFKSQQQQTQQLGGYDHVHRPWNHNNNTAYDHPQPPPMVNFFGRRPHRKGGGGGVGPGHHQPNGTPGFITGIQQYEEVRGWLKYSFAPLPFVDSNLNLAAMKKLLLVVAKARNLIVDHYWHDYSLLDEIFRLAFSKLAPSLQKACDKFALLSYPKNNLWRLQLFLQTRLENFTTDAMAAERILGIDGPGGFYRALAGVEHHKHEHSLCYKCLRFGHISRDCTCAFFAGGFDPAARFNNF